MLGQPGPGGTPNARTRGPASPKPIAKAPGEGTGLGLSIARDIAREHGGWISVSDAVEGGARFELCWPVGRNRASVPSPLRGFDAVRNRESHA